MYHTLMSLFFWIVLCCPVVVAAEGDNSMSVEPNEYKTFKECVLKEKEWKTTCRKYLEDPSILDNPYTSQAGVSDNLIPERGGVWGQTPAGMFREIYLPYPEGRT